MSMNFIRNFRYSDLLRNLFRNFRYSGSIWAGKKYRAKIDHQKKNKKNKPGSASILIRKLTEF